MSLILAIKDYLNYLRIERNLSAATIGTYGRDLHRLLKFTEREGEVVPVKNFTTGHIRAFLVNLELTNVAISLRKHITTFRGFFLFLVENKEIAESPMGLIRLPKTPKRLPKYLFAQELVLLLDALSDNGWREKRDRAMIVLLAMTGIRLTELVSLDVDSIESQPKNGSEHGLWLMTVMGKGAKERKVPLNLVVVAALESYFNARPPADTNALFLNKHKGRISTVSVQQHLKRYANAAGITRIRVSPHKLRHTFATLLHEADVDILEIQRLLGHSSLATTMIYTHTNPKQLQKAVKTLEKVCDGSFLDQTG